MKEEKKKYSKYIATSLSFVCVYYKVVLLNCICVFMILILIRFIKDYRY